MSDSPVRLMHHDPSWRQEFQQTRSSLLQSCVGWVTGVEHVGSTAIPGLIARPTVDVIATIDDPDGITQATLLIEGLNYRRVQSPSWATESVTLRKPRDLPSNDATPSHLVFLMKKGSEPATRAVAIRDFLRANAEHAFRFEETKVARWRRGQGDQAQYESDKSIFFAHLIDQLDV